MEPIQVFDDVLPDPDAYRAMALACPFGDVMVGGDTFRGIALCPDPALVHALMTRLPDADPALSFFRKSPAGQQEPNYIHSDADMGDWTGIFYLNPRPALFDGTTFWERASSGQQRGPWDAEHQQAARDASLWFPYRQVPARYNRLLVFQSDLFHSRTLADNYGEGDNARLIQVVFGHWRREVQL